MAISNVKALINGQTVSLTFNPETGNYEAAVSAPSKSSYNEPEHYYGISVTATDDAGNFTTKTHEDSLLGSSLRLKVKEKVKPIISLTSPSNDSTLVTNTPQIIWQITDDDSGVDPATIKKAFSTTLIPAPLS